MRYSTDFDLDSKEVRKAWNARKNEDDTAPKAGEKRQRVTALMDGQTSHIHNTGYQESPKADTLLP